MSHTRSACATYSCRTHELWFFFGYFMIFLKPDPHRTLNILEHLACYSALCCIEQTVCLSCSVPWLSTKRSWSRGPRGPMRSGLSRRTDERKLRLYVGFLKQDYPQIIHYYNGIFHYKPSIWGYPIDGNPHIGVLWILDVSITLP